MQYTVGLENIPETDQLVLKLIFSLSEKAKGRTSCYKVKDNTSMDRIDVLIKGIDGHVASEIVPGHGTVIYNLNGSSAKTDGNAINKPLIATRVLSVLDDVVKQRAGIEHSVAVDPESVDCLSKNQSVDEPATEIDFCITEEEASELAIVDDEALSNPSNHSIDGDITSPMIHKAPLAAIPTQHIASLVRLHPGKESDGEGYPVSHSIGMSENKNRPRALVVDDSPSVRKQIELELDLFNVNVDYAADMAAAMELAKQHQYNIAFLDVVLPDGDGFQICKTIKHDIKDITVIMLTGKASPADKIKGTMVGCDAYLVKPVGRMTFQNTVCRYLQLREQFEAIHG